MSTTEITGIKFRSPFGTETHKMLKQLDKVLSWYLGRKVKKTKAGTYDCDAAGLYTVVVDNPVIVEMAKHFIRMDGNGFDIVEGSENSTNPANASSGSSTTIQRPTTIDPEIIRSAKATIRAQAPEGTAIPSDVIAILDLAYKLCKEKYPSAALEFQFGKSWREFSKEDLITIIQTYGQEFIEDNMGLYARALQLGVI